MTAEVAILNRNAVALAADSAVTLGSGKVFNSVNKIFSLSKYHPVGIMIYGSADFMGIPWESVIKIYRQFLKKTRYNTLEEYANHFIEFIATEKIFHKDEKTDFRAWAYRWINMMFDGFQEALKKAPSQLSGKQILDLAYDLFSERSKKIKKWNTRHSDAAKYKSSLRKKYSNEIEVLIDGKFGVQVLERRHRNLLINIVLDAIIRDPPSRRLNSGLVFSGFGEKEIFPSYIHF